MKEPDFASVAIVGLGLMGGSVALALQEREHDIAIIGIDNNPNVRADATRHGIAASADLSDIIKADVVVLATPVRSILEQLPLIGEHAKPGGLILDLGSTKREIVNSMEILPERLQPIGGHPMCGKESAGFQAADANLYQGAAFVLTPLTRTTTPALERAHAFVRLLGAHPVVLDPDRHDRIVAAVSHLPFALAVVLMTLTMQLSLSDDAVFDLAAGGFRDSTRLAASDSRMMLDALLTNRDNVANLLRAFARELDKLADTVASGDDHALEPILVSAAQRRREMFK